MTLLYMIYAIFFQAKNNENFTFENVQYPYRKRLNEARNKCSKYWYM